MKYFFSIVFAVMTYMLSACSVSLSGNYTQAEIIAAAGTCTEFIIADGVTVGTNGDWDLTSLGAVTFTIEGSGSLQINGNGGGSDEITLLDGSSIVIEDTSNTNALSGGTSNNQPRITVGTTVYKASDYPTIIAAGGFGPALPVELMEFSIVNKGDFAKLYWITTKEVDNAGFNIQFSVDGKEWKSMDFVSGKGNSSSEVNYEYRVDDEYMNMFQFVRLKQEDYNGAYAYSKVLELPRIKRLRAYPNPTSDYVYFGGVDGAMSLKIYDLTGRVVKSLNVTSDKVSLEDLNAGSYVVEIKHGGWTERLTIVKK